MRAKRFPGPPRGRGRRRGGLNLPVLFRFFIDLPKGLWYTTSPWKWTGSVSEMKNEDLRYLRELAYFASIGLSISLSIFIGLGLGVYLDGKFGTRPWLTLVGIGLGIAAGYRNIGLAIRKSRKF